VGHLAPNASTQVSFVVTATETVINADYRASSTGGYSAIGPWLAVIVDPLQVFLPTVRK
jgi:hypothetical protein